MSELSETQYESQRLQAERCRDLLREARDLRARVTACEAQVRSIAKSWDLDLESLKDQVYNRIGEP